MKILFKYVFVAAITATIFSCKKDNYSPPSITLTGQLVYQGTPIQVEKDAVHFQIYQYGFGRVGPVSTNTTFAEDGTYSALLFAGDYKLTIPNGDGPFMWKQTVPGVPDSISVSVTGNQTVDFEVTPYYMIGSPQIAAVGTDSISASCQVQKIVTDSVNAKNIEYVALYVNKTQFVAGSTSIATVTLPGSAITDMNSIQLGVHVPVVVPTQNYMFARIGLKMVNVEDLMFSPLVKITF